MPEFPPPGFAQDAAERSGQALTPDAVSAVLADFHAWLTALTSATDEQASEAASVPPEQISDTIDLHTLLGQFIAVRQEVNLQTRAVRTQQEQNSETLRQLTTALDALRQNQARGEEARQQSLEESVRPLLKTLIDVYDALALASREMRRLRDTVLPSLEQFTAATSKQAAPPAPLSFWVRIFHSSAAQTPTRTDNRESQQEREHLARDSAERVRQFLASLLTGYTMSLQRIERSLRQHGLEAIPTKSERFDPERMEVVEAVADSGRPSGEVIEEIRRGYLWNGRVFRYAQVRVAKS
ncbi:MAG: nucleotide exchange factor GrpE [Gemmataceae bacterium]